MGDAPDADRFGTLERRWCSETLWDLARGLRRSFVQAELADRERVALWHDRPPSELVAVAFRQLERALVIGYGTTPVSDRARAVREVELEQASDNVRLAIAGVQGPREASVAS